MDYHETVKRLTRHVTQHQLARAIPASLSAVNAAGLRHDSDNHRSPPPGWQPAALILAREAFAHFAGLVADLERA
jgi:hypothetical protein